VTPDVYRGKVIVVTGGAGCIGSNLIRGLLPFEPAKILVIDDLSAAEAWNVPVAPAVQFIRGSVLDDEVLRYAFAERPTFVFHLAAFYANQNSVEHPESDLQVNGLGTLKVLQCAQAAGSERVIYASSGCSVYGRQAPLPLREDFLSIELDTPYQITKMLGELYCNFFKNYYGLATVRARFFNVYGPGEIPGRYRNVIPNFIYWAMRGQPLPITGTGEETRDFTFVDDIVDGLLRAGSRPEVVGEAFNLASGRETTVLSLAHQINELVGNAAGVTFTSRRKWDTHTRRCASVEKARALIGYSPRTDFRTGLERTIAWFRSDWSRIEAAARF